MASKEELLDFVRSLGEHKKVTRHELLEAFDEGRKAHTDLIFTKKLEVAEIMYFLGGAIILMGVCVLLAQNWTTMAFFGKVLATAGFGIVSYVVGIILNRDKRTEAIGSVFFLISAIVMPIGLWILLDHAGIDTASFGVMCGISGFLFFTYLASYFIFRKNIFTLFSILYGTWFFVAATSLSIEHTSLATSITFVYYRVLAMGVSYCLLGYAFKKDERRPMSGFLYNFGILGILSSTLALGGWKPEQSYLWEILYPSIVFGVVFLSVHLKSRSFLVWGTLFLMIFILKITAEYFAAGLGWPFSLIIAGFMIILTGYASLQLRKKFLS